MVGETVVNLHVLAIYDKHYRHQITLDKQIQHTHKLSRF
jgi:hypothetical protein